ncbi:unnamed protein product [Effrenium voratum]|uniref:Transmembrane protein n=1 Tax=Effrenium voratum TaxID=2562239 RepID=A0AA36HM38_9DINO|nr:unnamed protein product [Effrenium voratum]
MDDFDVDADVPTDRGRDVQETLETQAPANEPEIWAMAMAFLTNMQVTRPELLRAVPARWVLARAWSILGSASYVAGLYEASVPVTQIQEFWSHSWQGSPWKKALTLLVAKNGLASLVGSTLLTMLFAGLFALGWLPGYAKDLTQEDGDFLNSVWCLAVGAVSSCILALLWRPPGLVFLDRVCIDQSTRTAKCEGVLNIGAFLKNSITMVVIWDPTYVKRLWCVFELAAYLKSHEDERKACCTEPARMCHFQQWSVFSISYMRHTNQSTTNATIPRIPLWAQGKLVVLPSLLGPCSVAFALGCCSFMAVLLIVEFASPIAGVAVLVLLGTAGFYLAAAQFREIYRDLDSMQAQMKEFEVDKAESFCCSCNHLNSKGQNILCDRELVKACIISWFGTIESFEEAVRSKVLPAMSAHLRHPFSYLSLVGVLSPLMWGTADAVAAQLRNGNEQFAAYYAINGLMWWLFGMPCLYVGWNMLVFRCRRKRAALWKDVLTNLAIMPAIAVLLCLQYGVGYVFAILTRNRVQGVCIYTAVMAVLTLVIFCRRR